jgi:MFS family permease
MERAFKMEEKPTWGGGIDDVEEFSFIFKTYKMRFYGIVLIALANIASSLNWLSVAPVPDLANEYFNNCGLSTINWFSNIFMLAYIIAGPVSSWVYDRWSIKTGVCRKYILLYM